MATSSEKKEMIESQSKESNEESSLPLLLPDDVVLEVLSRLPPKPFFRFKCVSKTWLALSSHAFRRNKFLQPTFLGFFWVTETPYELGFTDISGGAGGRGVGGAVVDGTLRALPPHDGCCIVDCCNGLLLVRCIYCGPQIFLCNYAYNPATRKHTAIQWSPLLKTKWYEVVLHSVFSLAFDPRNGLQFHVVCFRHSHETEGGCTNVFSTFSSHSGRWQLEGTLECALKIAEYSNGTFFHGRVHRVTQGHEIVSVDPINNSCLVTKFDFPGLSDNIGFSEIGQSHGLLHFMFGNKSRKVSIWVSENGDLQKWIFKHQLSLDEMHFGDVYGSFRHIKLHPEKDALLVHLGNGHILSIELSTGKSNEICVLPSTRCPTVWLFMPFFLI
ncbi:F-box family protein [Rhynchospora pubera]|uniref:F-box family protein n=1 Tax=Rhynchospora pubera TaxID=906938 RepID=A0AAV8DQT2_9POAL|nr:F-box family protein [Rhynchospora pubera]